MVLVIIIDDTKRKLMSLYGRGYFFVVVVVALAVAVIVIIVILVHIICEAAMMVIQRI